VIPWGGWFIDRERAESNSTISPCLFTFKNFFFEKNCFFILNYFFIFLYRFNMLISKIILKNINNYFNIFLMKNNYYYIFKYVLRKQVS